METYKLFRIVKRKNKEGRVYFLAIVILSTDYDCDIVRVLINEKQADALMKAMSTNDFDLSKYFKIVYNTYNKQYQPSITYGL